LSLNPEAEKIVFRAVTDLSKQYLPARHFKVFLFGSRVWGTANNRSDFDIGIESDEKIPIGSLGNIREKLEDLPVLQKVDIVDFGGVADTFKNHAKKKIKIIYEQ
jgi:predicted nucleotidyltransferase